MQVRKWRSKVGQRWVPAEDILRVVKDSDLLAKLKKAGKELTQLKQLMLKHNLSLETTNDQTPNKSNYSTQRSFNGSTPRSAYNSFKKQ